jgi:hypothetical protein
MLVTEPFVLDFLTATMSGRSAEKQVYDAIRLREALDAMPQDARELWEQRLFGYTFEEISEETHESADTLNTRARRGVKEAMNRLFGHGKRWTTISLLMDEEKLSPDDERRPLDLFEQAALHAYPNPQRSGCPGADFLRLLAINRRSISVQDPRLTHVARCSPCFQEFAALRDAQARRRSRLRLLPIAAGVLLAAIGVTAYLERSRLFPVASSGASAQAGGYIAALLDLKDRSAVRGVSKPTAEEPKPDSLKLPREKLNLTVTLPFASPAGEYEIQVLKKIGHPLLSTSGAANIQSGLTMLSVHLDISGLAPGRYLLGIRRVPWDWTFHPVLIDWSKNAASFVPATRFGTA